MGSMGSRGFLGTGVKECEKIDGPWVMECEKIVGSRVKECEKIVGPRVVKCENIVGAPSSVRNTVGLKGTWILLHRSKRI